MAKLHGAVATGATGTDLTVVSSNHEVPRHVAVARDIHTRAKQACLQVLRHTMPQSTAHSCMCNWLQRNSKALLWKHASTS